MPSQAMQNLIEAFRDRRKARAGEAPPTMEELRAAFAPAGRLHPVSDDVLVTEVTADGVPANWLDAGADTGRVLLFLRGGSLAGFPPLLVQAGTAELLLSDSERLARAAAEAGVDVTL